MTFLQRLFAPTPAQSARDLALAQHRQREAKRRFIIDEMRAKQGKPAWKWGPL